jgi:hypothetical protein
MSLLVVYSTVCYPILVIVAKASRAMSSISSVSLQRRDYSFYFGEAPFNRIVIRRIWCTIAPTPLIKVAVTL